MTGLSPLRALTGRGRGLATVGLVAVVLGVASGQHDLIRIGVLLLALPAVALAVLARSRVRLACTREPSDGSVPEGGTATVRLTVANVSRLATGVLLLSDRVPRLLGDSPHFLVAQVQPGRSARVEYDVHGTLRGRYDVGPLSVRLSDPFGLTELVRVFPGTAPLVVTPAVEALPAVRLGGDRSVGPEGGGRATAAAGEQDASTREWRQGDDLRRVHWRSTARTGELMVRQEEQPSRTRAVVLLDARAAAHTGSGPASTLETAVRAAASVGVHLVGTGSALRLLPLGAGRDAPAGGPPPPVAGLEVDGEGSVDVLLERLAVLRAGRDVPGLAPALAALGGGAAWRETLVVAVLGRVDAADADALARLRTGGRTCVAVLTAAPQAAAPATDAAVLLRAAGWRAVALPPRASLAAAWSGLGERGVRGGPVAAGPGDGGRAWRPQPVPGAPR